MVEKTERVSYHIAFDKGFCQFLYQRVAIISAIYAQLLQHYDVFMHELEF